MKAGYSATSEGFIKQDANAIVATLTHKSQSVVLRQEPVKYTKTWNEKIGILQNAISSLRDCSEWSNWTIFLEYPIPWTVRHIDAVILARDLVIAIEIRTADDEYELEDVAEVEDFCLHLSDFHADSVNRLIIPILVSAKAPSTATHHTRRQDWVQQVFLSNEERLTQILGYVVESYTTFAPSIDSDTWEKTELRPMPTLIQATQALYAGEHVDEPLIAENNIVGASTAEAPILQLINTAKEKKERILCFVDGIPGAGKTLTGLSVAYKSNGLYLSGNATYIDVLQRAIMRESHESEDPTIADNRRDTYTFVRDLYQFFDRHYGGSILPEQHVIVVDDAHRSRDPKHFPKKYVRQRTEAAMLLDIMSRAEDWAVVVALVGKGELITPEEAGLPEWAKSLAQFSDWKVVMPPTLLGNEGEVLFPEAPSWMTLKTDLALNLCTCHRTFQAPELVNAVEAILAREAEKAESIISNRLQRFPIFYTRNLDDAKKWLRSKRGGRRSIGLIASTGAKRLKAHGLEVADRLDVKNWYLNPADDVRSASHLEVASRERHMQGLELDWACVCWGADLRHDSADWQYARFHGSSWLLEEDDDAREVIRNRYRVLLTRARSGLVIWIPRGDGDDPTRLPVFYEHTANYLASCGIPELKVD